MLNAIFDETRRAEIRRVLEKGEGVEFRKAKPLPEKAAGIHFFIGQ